MPLFTILHSTRKTDRETFMSFTPHLYPLRISCHTLDQYTDWASLHEYGLSFFPWSLSWGVSVQGILDSIVISSSFQCSLKIHPHRLYEKTHRKVIVKITHFMIDKKCNRLYPWNCISHRQRSSLVTAVKLSKAFTWGQTQSKLTVVEKNCLLI